MQISSLTGHTCLVEAVDANCQTYVLFLKGVSGSEILRGLCMSLLHRSGVGCEVLVNRHVNIWNWMP